MSSAPTQSHGESSHTAHFHFPGWGEATRIEDLEREPVPRHSGNVAPAHRLGVWQATAICGNDVTSSVLYVAAICVGVAGPLAPISLAMVAAVLYLFRRIYSETGSALPLNGGVYNVLLNTTTKPKASLAACLSLLSYVATAVISASEAMHYLHDLVPAVPVMTATVVLLAAFALLNILGITESAVVALGIFVIHLSALAMLLVVGATFVFTHGLSTWDANWAGGPPGGVGRALFLGFAAGMLGISGFESSANFIEEQREGVFSLTLRNMWLAVSILNPAAALLTLSLMPLADVATHSTTLLSELARRSGSDWMAYVISVDAVLVLSGAVLTSYVGITGLMRRMALDRCLPQVLLRENSRFRTPHVIIAVFFAVCTSVLLITRGNVITLAGVYGISFLGVMLMFAVGNRLLAMRRARLPRDVRASWPAVLLAGLACLVALVGTVMRSREQSLTFLGYLAATVAVVLLMLYRVRILLAILAIGKQITERVLGWNQRVAAWTTRHLAILHGQTVVYFTRGDDLVLLRRAVEYVLANEEARHLRVVFVYQHDAQLTGEIAAHLSTLDKVYPEIRIDFVAVRGVFGPEIIRRLSARFAIPLNYMFIGCPGDRFPHQIEDLGGVRLIV